MVAKKNICKIIPADLLFRLYIDPEVQVCRERSEVIAIYSFLGRRTIKHGFRHACRISSCLIQTFLTLYGFHQKAVKTRDM